MGSGLRGVQPSRSSRAAIARGLLATATIGGMLVGVPLVLAQLAGNPLPARLPSAGQLESALTQGQISDGTLVKILASVCWLAWLELVFAFGAEIVEATWGRVTRVPAPRSARRFATGLVATVAIGFGAVTGRHVQPAPEQPLRMELANTGAFPERAGAPPTTASTADGSGETSPTPAPEGSTEALHVVAPRETLWSIAEARLGDPYRWPELFEHNRGRRQPDGRSLERPDQALRPGWTLSLPDSGAARSGPPGNGSTAATEKAGSIIVQTGDTLWDLAHEHLDDAHRWPSIFRPNRGRQQADGRTLEDPDLILPGWTLLLPSDRTTATAPPDSEIAADPEKKGRVGGEGDRRRGGGTPTSEPTRAPDGTSEADPVPGTELPPSAGGSGGRGVAPTHPGRPDLDEARPGPGNTSRSDDSQPSPRSPTGFPRDDDPLPGPAASGARQNRSESLVDDDANTPAGPPIQLPAPETWPDRSSPTTPSDREATSGQAPAEVELDDQLDILDRAPLPVRPRSLVEALAGAGIFAAGLVLSIERRRRRQERRRRAGGPRNGTEPPAAQIELGLRASATRDESELVTRALHLMAAGLHHRAHPVPTIVGVNVGDDVSILLASRDHDAPEGFEIEDAGFSWVIDRSSIDGAEIEGAPLHPLPTLFTAGHTSRSQVLLNPESLGSISVGGTNPQVHETLFGIAVELATGQRGDVRVIAVGFGRELSGLERVEAVDHLESILPGLASRSAQLRASVEAQSSPSTVAVRVASHESADLTPTVVVCNADQPTHAIAQLLDIAGERSGIAAVVAGEWPCPWKIEVSDCETRLAPVGVRLQRHHLDPSTRSAITLLLQEHDSDAETEVSGTVPPMRPSKPRQTSLGTDLDGTADDEHARPEVEIQVLGPVLVTGAETEFPRRKALEMVVYLAFHSHGVDSDVLAEALWPGRLVSPNTLHSTASVARRSLGRDSDGEPHLPSVGPDGVYRLATNVSSDYSRFLQHVEHAARGEGAATIHHFRIALSLVRGRPFTTPGTEYLWAHAEALISGVAADVVDAAHQMASLCGDAGELQAAWWATQQGLLASPGNEQLHRDRMLILDRRGDPEGIEVVMHELCRAIGITDDERDEVLHPHTVELYQRLTRRRMRRTLVGGA